MDVVIQWTGWFGFITGIMVLVVSIMKYKYIFTFPSVFMVYMTLSYFVVETFVLITIVNPSCSLYCNDHSLVRSINDTTIFCKVSGIVFHYCLVNTTLWWFFHVSVLFYKMMFPLQAKQTEKYEKYVHIALLCLGIIFPLPAVIYTLVYSNYITVMFPPLLCYPFDANVFYYSTILVLNVLTAFGVSMFIPMFWVVHKHQGIFRSRIGRIQFSVAEIKLLFVLCYYAAFGIATVLYLQLTLHDEERFLLL